MVWVSATTYNLKGSKELAPLRDGYASLQDA
jgi:hypothetical protein